MSNISAGDKGPYCRSQLTQGEGGSPLPVVLLAVAAIEGLPKHP
jgi:hypothetical protein